MATPGITAGITSAVQISGSVHGGQQPVSGATVQLWETGTAGYGKGSTQLLSSTTTAVGTGNFSFPTANVPANCTGGPYTYITSSGGDPTAQTATNLNPAINLVAVIGNCSTTGASTTVNINEVTTIAAAYALSGFASDAAGTVSVGAPSTNAQGLTDAIANAGLLANSANGLANISTTTMVLPTTMINSLANSIASCVNTTTTTSTPTTACSTLFGYTTAPVSKAVAPTDTFQAALNMARYPGSNVSNILNLASGTAAPFNPSVATTSVTSTNAPNDISLGISYPNATLQQAGYNNYVSSSSANNPVGFTIDNTDNLWSVGATNGTLDTSHYNYISELTSPSNNPTYSNTLGSTAALDATHTLRTAAFDTLGNLWLSDKNASGGSLIDIPAGMSASSAAEQTSFTTLALGAGSLDPNDWWVAVDASNNLWTTSYGGAGNCTANGTGTVCDYIEYAKSGTTYTPTVLFGGNPQSAPTSRGGVADTNSASKGLGNIWATNYGIVGGSTAGTSVEVLTPATGVLATIALGSTAARPQGVALDSAGNGYITTNATAATSGLWQVPQGTASGTIASVVSTSGQSAITTIPTTSSSPASTASTAVQTGGINTPGYDAVDGAGNVWVANLKYGTTVEYSPSLSAYLSPYYGFSPSLTTSSAVTATAAQVTLFVSSSTNQANIYAPNNITVGQAVTLSGFTGTYACMNGGPYNVIGLGTTVDSYFVVTGLSSSCGSATVSKAAATGTITVSSSNQAVFTCSGSTVSCSVNAGQIPSNNYISIDRAGTVWSMTGNGTLTGIIGTAAPTNPVLAAGQAGVTP